MTEQPKGPQDDRLFAPRPGIYYAAMWNAPLPYPSSNGLGGCVTFQLWRPEHDTTDWHLLHCFRYYNTFKAWTPGDVLRWASLAIKAPQPEVIAKTKLAFEMMGLHEMAMMEINGDWQAFVAAVKRDKPDWCRLIIVEASHPGEAGGPE